jgi:16S rRNA (adenine1518-N6/adenine1519-N6)-dimethyltransferase
VNSGPANHPDANHRATVHWKNRQTLSYLRNLFEERGIRPRSKLGQNFLIDLNLIEVLLRAAELSKDDLAVEVGSGTGSLTVSLIEQAGAVLSVEIDPAFAALTEEAVAMRLQAPADVPGPDGLPEPAPVSRPDTVRLLRMDVLARKNELAPEFLTALGELPTHAGTRRIKLVANLPYAIAVPVISNLLLTDIDIDRMAVTVQWEIAERLLAPVGTSQYSSLAVLVQSLAEVELLRRLPPTVFWPRPQVDSAMVLIRPDPVRRARVVEHCGTVGGFRGFLRDLYVHRRKNLRGALVSLPSGRRRKEEVDTRLAELGIPGTTRAEDLDVQQHLRLCAVFG